MNLDRLGRLLCIDPGTRRLGWATFYKGRLESSDNVVISVNMVKDDWLRRTDVLTDMVVKLAIQRQVKTVIIEQPQFFLSSVKGLSAADSGSILKLMSLVMSIRTAIRLAVVRADIVLVPVTSWKGQTPKIITKNRMERRYGQVFEDDNECDAVGLGDWYLRNKLGIDVEAAS